jgi:hypothetical protein
LSSRYAIKGIEKTVNKKIRPTVCIINWNLQD